MEKSKLFNNAGRPGDDNMGVVEDVDKGSAIAGGKRSIA